MDLAFRGAIVRGYEIVAASMTNDRKDRHVLAATVVSEAQLIATANVTPPKSMVELAERMKPTTQKFGAALVAEFGQN